MFTAEKPEELPSRGEALSMSGLEFMTAILEGRISSAPIAGILNYELESVERGRVSFAGTPEFASLNPLGTVHGGWYGTLLDSCMACAFMTTLKRGSSYTTLEYKVNIVRSVPVGVRVRATGEVQHSGRTTGVASGEIRGIDDGRLYATGSTTCLVLSGG